MVFICKTAIVTLAFVHFVSPFITLNLAWLTFLLGCIILLTSLPLMEKAFQKSSLVFLLVGVILMLVDKQPFTAWIAGMNSMLIVSSIVVIMQLFSIPINAGNYHAALENLLFKRVNKESTLFVITSVVTHLFSSFLLMGTIPVMFSLMGDLLKKKVSDYERFIITTLTRSFSLVVLWAPGAVNILLALKATGAKWVDLFLPGVILSVLGLGTSYIIELKLKRLGGSIGQGNNEAEQSTDQRLDKGALVKGISILGVVAALVLLTALFEKMNISDSSTHRIMMAGIIVVSLWILVYAKNERLGCAFKDYWQNGVYKVIDLSGLFAAMGIFSEALGRSTVMEWIQGTLPAYAAVVDILFPLLIPAIILILSMIGVHPYISIVMMGKILASIPMTMAPALLALTLLIGGTVSYIISPFAGTVLIISRYLQRKPLSIIRENWIFSLIFLLEGALLIYLMHIFL